MSSNLELYVMNDCRLESANVLPPRKMSNMGHSLIYDVFAVTTVNGHRIPLNVVF